MKTNRRYAALALFLSGCIGVAYATTLYTQKGPHPETRPTLSANQFEQRNSGGNGWTAAGFGTSSGNIAQGNDSRFPASPSAAGGTLYDNGSSWQRLAAGTANYLYQANGAAPTSWVNSLTGITINGSTNTLSNIGNSSLSNSSITLSCTGLSGCGSVALGATLSPAVSYGTTSNTATQGNDTRLPPAPSTAGKLVVDTGSAYTGAAVTLTQYITPGSTTWSPQATTKRILVRVWGAGGSGGSGRRGTTGSSSGGSGGGGGGYSERWLLASEWSAPVTVTTGAGAAGASVQSTNDTNGNPGTTGGTSSFGSYLRAVGGGGGNGGSTGTTSGGGGGTAWNVGTTGGSAPVNANGTNGSATSGTLAGAGGGSGGGTISGSFGAGGASSFPSALQSAGTAGGATVGSGGSDGSKNYSGTGGGGGAAGDSAGTIAGGKGGNGAQPGGGGGGGGASTDGANSGAGGNSGDGEVDVYEYPF